MAGSLRESVDAPRASFNVIKQTLVDAGKIILGEGKISNARFERQSSVERQEAEQLEQNGRTGGEKSAKNQLLTAKLSMTILNHLLWQSTPLLLLQFIAPKNQR